jgi:hypothetical protein
MSKSASKYSGFRDQKSRPVDRDVERTGTTGSLTSLLVISTHLSEKVSFLDLEAYKIVLLVIASPVDCLVIVDLPQLIRVPIVASPNLQSNTITILSIGNVQALVTEQANLSRWTFVC